MRIVKNALGSIVVASLLVSQPLLAATEAAARTSSPNSDAEKMHGGLGSAVGIIGIFAALLLLAQVTDLIHVFGHDASDFPTSP